MRGTIVGRGPYGLTARQRFDRFVSPEPNSGCWLWLGAYIRKGYGMFGYSPNNVRLATHVALEFDGRERPTSKSIARHKCDNPACVNPDHLEWGSHKDNHNDMVSRGRDRMDSTRKTHCVRGHDLAETSYIRGNGYRQCRECDNIRNHAKMAEKAAIRCRP